MISAHTFDCSYDSLDSKITKINELTDKKPIDLTIRDVPNSAFDNESKRQIQRLVFNNQGILLRVAPTSESVTVSKICYKLHGISRDNPISITLILSNNTTTVKNFIGLPLEKVGTTDANVASSYNLNLKFGNVIIKNTKQVTNANNAFSGITARQACLENPLGVTSAENLYKFASINVVDLKRFSNISSTSNMFYKTTLSEVDLTSMFESKSFEKFSDFGKLINAKTVIKMLPSPLVCQNVDKNSEAIKNLLNGLFYSSENKLYTSKEIFEKLFGAGASKQRLVAVKAAYQYSYVKTSSPQAGEDGSKDRKVSYKKDYEKYLDGTARSAIYLKDESTGALINVEELINLINDADKVDRAGDIMRGTLNMSADLINQVPDVHHGNAYTIFSGNSDNSSNIMYIKTNGNLWTQGDITGSRVFNAVWNDLVDLIIVPEDTKLEYGRCYVTNGKTYKFSEKYCQEGIIGIHSDTAGFGMGKVPDKKQIHTAVAGYVLAFVDKIYPSGTPLTCGKNGTLTKMKLKDRIIHPERLVATFWKDEPEEVWNARVQVNGRKWVKVI